MKHQVKFTRHWKGCFKITLSDAELRYIFHDEEALNKFIDDTIQMAYDKLFRRWIDEQPKLEFSSLLDKIADKQAEQRKEFPYPWWNDIPKGTMSQRVKLFLNRIYGNNNQSELWDGYGYIKEDKPII